MSDLDELQNDDLVTSFDAPEHVKGTVPAGLMLSVVRLDQRHVRIESNHAGLPYSMFDDAYVELSGYVGAYNPNIFAAAPELLAALKALRNECSGRPRADVLLALLAQADAAIAKADLA